MTAMRMAVAIIAGGTISGGILAGGALAGENDSALEPGLYKVEVRLEIPNVWNWTAARSTTICVADAPAPGELPLPVLSGNNPFSKCRADSVDRDGARLAFDIVCEGRDAAKARARYTLARNEFRGRIRMVMGAKNMTITEVQSGRRIGSCDRAGAPP